VTRLVRIGRYDREWPLNDGQRPNSRGVLAQIVLEAQLRPVSCFLCSALLPSAFISASMVLSLLPISSQSSPPRELLISHPNP
jgi:hypothetical protein